MSATADYFRARAMEERFRAQDAGRVYLARLHRDLAAQLDRKARECDTPVSASAPFAETRWR
jgi:hypothetical protein